MVDGEIQNLLHEKQNRKTKILLLFRILSVVFKLVDTVMKARNHTVLLKYGIVNKPFPSIKINRKRCCTMYNTTFID